MSISFLNYFYGKCAKQIARSVGDVSSAQLSQLFFWTKKSLERKEQLKRLFCVCECVYEWRADISLSPVQ